MSESKTINYTREAFLHPGNLLFLLVATLSAFFVGGSDFVSQLVLLSAFGIELVYLGTVPRTERFQKSIKMRRLQEEHTMSKDQQVFQRLDSSTRRRFLVLKHISNQIKQNFAQLPASSRVLLDSITTKMDGLLTNYIVNLELLNRYKHYLQNSSAEDIRREMTTLEKEIESAQWEKVREIKQRRLSILQKRLEKLEKADEKYQICHSQLETIEDAIRYMYEKSMTMNNPEEIGLQLDNLIQDLEETATMMEDIEDDLPPTYTVLQQLEDMQAEQQPASGKVSNKLRSK